MKRLKTWAAENDVHYETARRWAAEDKMPVKTIKTDTGRYLVVEDTDNQKSKTQGKTVAYARVSSHDQKGDLDAQVGRIMTGYGKPIDEVVTEIGSGMNPGRAKLNKILANPDITTIVVEHRDRLARMNVELIQSALKAQGRDIIVIQDNENDNDIVQDIVDFMTSVCARMYGKRGAKNRAERAVKVLKEGE